MSVLRVIDYVWGVAQLHDIVYVVRYVSSTITRFNITTRQRLSDIHVAGLQWSWDIAACELTSRVYIAEEAISVSRVSADGADIQHWLPKSPDDTFTPSTLSVTSTRLLVTSLNTHQLTQFQADGDEVRRVQLSDHMEPWHAVESPTETFIVRLYNVELDLRQVAEIDTLGEVLRQFSGSRLTSLGYTPHFAADSRGNIFVADEDNRHVLLLDDHLSLRRVIDEHQQLKYKEPRRLCYNSQHR